MKISKTPIIILTTLLLSSCQGEIKKENEKIIKEVTEALVEKKPSVSESYLRILPKASSTEKISFSGRKMELGDLLKYSLPKDIKVNKMDNMVSFEKPIQVAVKDLAIDEYLEIIFGKTDYEYQFDAESRILDIYFMQQKTWHLAAFTTTIETSGSMGSAGLTSKSDKSIDKWESIINASKTILDLQSVKDTDTVVDDLVGKYKDDPKSFDIEAAKDSIKNQSEESKSDKVSGEWMIEDRNMATLTVYASAKKIKKLDSYIKSQKILAKTQIKMSIKAFEVSLSKDNSTGIDWSLFDERKVLERDHITGQFQSNAGVVGALASLGTNTTGLELAGRIKGVGVKAIMNFLEQQGEVHLVTEPTITVLNGGSAFLSSGDKITYNSGFQSIAVEGGDPIFYPSTEQADIGTKIVLTPNITEDGNVMIDVLATLTSLKSMNTVTIPIGTIDKPELGVQEISTQILAKNNESIRLGGLIIHRLSTASSEVDVENKILSSPFNSAKNNLEKRELVIVITPKIIY